MDELNALPYLDCVVHETLRVYAPVTVTSAPSIFLPIILNKPRCSGRIALRDDVVPLSMAVTDTKGRVHENLRYVFSPTVLLKAEYSRHKAYARAKRS